MARFEKRTSHDSPIWLTIFSDMTTNLMLFFLMLFALSRMEDSQKMLMVREMSSQMSDAETRQEDEQAREVKREREGGAIKHLKQVINRGALKRSAALVEDDKYLRLTLTRDVFFATGSAELGQVAREALAELVPPLKKFPNDIIIEGHTDNVPIRSGRYRSNWELSMARAVKVIDLLISKGLNPEQLVTGGYGEFHPAFPNDTEENRARNRRIEITIVRENL